MRPASSSRDREPEPAARTPTACRRRDRTGRRSAARCSLGIPGPSSSTASTCARAVARRAQASRSSRTACARARSRPARVRSGAPAPRPRSPTRPRPPRRGAGARSPPRAPPARRREGVPSRRDRRPPARCGSAPRRDARDRADRRSSLLRRSTCSRIVARKPRARLLVELLVGDQLEKAAEGEQRRPQLVRRVRDELLPRGVELGELQAHPVERRGQLAELVGAVVDDRLVELALCDPVRSPLQPSYASARAWPRPTVPSTIAIASAIAEAPRRRRSTRSTVDERIRQRRGEQTAPAPR